MMDFRFLWLLEMYQYFVKINIHFYLNRDVIV